MNDAEIKQLKEKIGFNVRYLMRIEHSLNELVDETIKMQKKLDIATPDTRISPPNCVKLVDSNGVCNGIIHGQETLTVYNKSFHYSVSGSGLEPVDNTLYCFEWITQEEAIEHPGLIFVADTPVEDLPEHCLGGTEKYKAIITSEYTASLIVGRGFITISPNAWKHHYKIVRRQA